MLRRQLGITGQGVVGSGEANKGSLSESNKDAGDEVRRVLAGSHCRQIGSRVI